MEQRKSGLRERKKEDVRARILTTAEAMFRQNGYVATSMGDIAQRVGISRKSLFNYMASKESIILALVEVFVGKNMPDWIETGDPSHHDVRDLIAPRLTERLNALAQNRWLLTLAAQHTRLLTSDSTEYLESTHFQNRLARARRIATVQAEGKIRDDIPALEISHYYEVMRDLAIRRWLLRPDSTAEDLHHSFAKAMDVLLRGLSTTSLPLSP